MSGKIKVGFIIKKHFKAAVWNAGNDKVDWPDFFVFIVLPFLLSGLFYWIGMPDKAGIISLLMSVSSIFAGLLLNLLVLVYDQNKRVHEKILALDEVSTVPPDLRAGSLDDLLNNTIPPARSEVHYRNYSKHAQLLEELFSSICFAIVVSLSSIVTGILSSLLKEDAIPFSIYKLSFSVDFKSLFITISVFFLINLLLTVLMVVKRVYKLMSSPI